MTEQGRIQRTSTLSFSGYRRRAWTDGECQKGPFTTRFFCGPA
ncbi:hypothetical protein [Methanofollis fontis]|nr:hypothetical protein [Methanofollis fontis]